MEKKRFDFIARVLRRYPHYDQEIAEIENELRHPYKESDNNIGGGSGSLLATDNAEIELIDKIEANPTIADIKHNQLVVNQAFYESDDLTRAIIQKMYMAPARDRLKIEGLALELNVNAATISRRRTAFFALIGSDLRIVHRKPNGYGRD